MMWVIAIVLQIFAIVCTVFAFHSDTDEQTGFLFCVGVLICIGCSFYCVKVA